MKRPGWMNPIDQWFGPKRFGYGITPRTWEGWTVTFLPIVLIAGVAVIVQSALSHPDPHVLDTLPRR